MDYWRSVFRTWNSIDDVIKTIELAIPWGTKSTEVLIILKYSAMLPITFSCPLNIKPTNIIYYTNEYFRHNNTLTMRIRTELMSIFCHSFYWSLLFDFFLHDIWLLSHLYCTSNYFIDIISYVSLSKMIVGVDISWCLITAP